MKLSATAKGISFALKLIVILSAAVGTFASWQQSQSAFMGGRVVFMYFTIQSNIAIALICLIGAILMLSRCRIPNFWYVIKFIGTIAITLTGIVFCFILAPTLQRAAWTLPNLLTHVIVPIASVIDFFITGVCSDLKFRHVFLVTIPPILYAIYAGIGYARNWQFGGGVNYPYFFLNWGSDAGVFGFSSELPFMGTGWWILALLVLLILAGLLYLAILRLLKRALHR